MIVFELYKASGYLNIQEYTMTMNVTDWRGHVLRYVQYFQGEAEWVENDTKNDEVHDKDCVEQEFLFQLFRNCEELLKVVK